MPEELVIRPASFDQALAPNHPANADVMKIFHLLNIYAAEHLLLSRDSEDILEKIGNFRIAELNGEFAGCAALRNYGGGLFEIRSLAVRRDLAGRRIGSRLVTNFLEEKKRAGEPVRIFALTYRANFFCNLGFRIVDKSMFPGKIWSDCVLCPKKDRCDETAVLYEIE